MTHFLKLKIGSKFQKGIVRSVCEDNVPDKYGVVLPKITLSVETLTNTFHTSEAWVRDREQILRPQGLWLKLDSDGNIVSECTISKMLTYYGAETLQALIEREVLLYPKLNGFYSVVAVDAHDELVKIVNAATSRISADS